MIKWKWIDVPQHGNPDDCRHRLVIDDGTPFGGETLLECGNLASRLQDRIQRIPLTERAALDLLDAYVEENGGDMPTNDDHPAHAIRDLLSGEATPDE